MQGKKKKKKKRFNDGYPKGPKRKEILQKGDEITLPRVRLRLIIF